MLRYTSILFYNEHVLNTCLILLNMNLHKKSFWQANNFVPLLG